jgi:hypothetical protein
MDRALDSLSSEFRPHVDRVLARLVERGVMVLIVQTSRTLAEHQANIANGTSRTSMSKHLPRGLRGRANGTPDDDRCDAIDLCPYDFYALNGPDKLAWDDTGLGAGAWAAIQDVGEAEGLRCGSRWHDPHDPGHLELLFDGERHADIPPTSAAWLKHGVPGDGSA